MKVLTIVSLLLSVSAVAAVLSSADGLSQLVGAAPASESAEGFAAGQEELESLRQEVSALRTRLAELEARAPEDEATVAVVQSELPRSTVQIEGIVSQIDPYGVIQAQTDRIDKARRTLLNPEASLRDRVNGARELKHRNLHDAESIAVLGELWKEAGSLDEKRQVMGAYGKGNVSLEMRDAFIAELQKAPPGDRTTERFYWQSVSTMSHMLPDPAVESWFKQVIKNANSDRLANQAARALGVEWESANADSGGR